MKNRLLIAAFVSIFFLTGSCQISSGQGKQYDFSSLDSVIQGWVDKGYYLGASVCVVKNDTVIFQKNYRDYTPDTKVYVASAGKWVAAAVVAAVVDRTDLEWDDPVEKWLPEFKGDAKGKILLRQLLSHTSGVRPYLPEPRIDNYNHLDSAVTEILPLDLPPALVLNMADLPCKLPEEWRKWRWERSLKLFSKNCWHTLWK